MPEPVAPTSSDDEATGGTAEEGTLTEVTARPVHISSQTSVTPKTSVGEQTGSGAASGPVDMNGEVASLDHSPRPGDGPGVGAAGNAELQVPPFVLLADRDSSNVYLLAVREESEPALSPTATISSALDANLFSPSGRSDKYAPHVLLHYITIKCLHS